jgi:hypothetical protein
MQVLSELTLLLTLTSFAENFLLREETAVNNELGARLEAGFI